ncbi:hypothetical protein [Streptomyces acidiscabies]|nr:hypothetical protein [Streptomyces acidiscabies]
MAHLMDGAPAFDGNGRLVDSVIEAKVTYVRLPKVASRGGR